MVFDKPNLAECWSPRPQSPVTPRESRHHHSADVSAFDDSPRRVVGFDSPTTSSGIGTPAIPALDEDAEHDVGRQFFVPPFSSVLSTGWKASSAQSPALSEDRAAFADDLCSRLHARLRVRTSTSPSRARASGPSPFSPSHKEVVEYNSAAATSPSLRLLELKHTAQEAGHNSVANLLSAQSLDEANAKASPVPLSSLLFGDVPLSRASDSAADLSEVKYLDGDDSIVMEKIAMSASWPAAMGEPTPTVQLGGTERWQILPNDGALEDSCVQPAEHAAPISATGQPQRW